ncbi:hypothetical protein MASR1M45_07510 [Candidatus Kapaibacterium sp.]
MFKKIIKLVVYTVLISILLPVLVSAQGDQSFRMKLENILSSYKNYRFSLVSVYRLKNINDVNKIIRERDAATGEGGEVVKADASVIQGVDATTLSIIEREAKNNASLSAVQRALVGRGLEIPANIEGIYTYYRPSRDIKRIQNVYVVTTRKEQDALTPHNLIAMIIDYEGSTSLKRNLDNKAANLIFTNPEMKELALNPTDYRADNLYDLVMNSFMQGNVEDKTLEAQGIGTLISFFPAKAGVTKSILNKEGTVSSYDIQLFKRIAEGQALEITDKFNEVIVSPDLISWRAYDYPMMTYSDGVSDTLSRVTNGDLPKYGIELKYGAEAINYPSFWSERLSVNAIWGGVKLGLVLPTNGWSSLSKDLYGVEPKLTYGGLGITGEADFPIAVIPKSGIFNASFAYILGDAEVGPLTPKDLKPDSYVTDPQVNDFMIRYNAQLHYTFGVFIDDNYLLRFGLGGTIYGIERWYNRSVEDPNTRRNSISFERLDDEAIGGISGRVEFMARNVATPFGMSAQYFDEGIYTNIWLQVPLVKNTFSLRLDAKGYFKAFASEPREWENKSVFMPMARFIVNF